jgi:membrane associated rhomboid family serine protease
MSISVILIIITVAASFYSWNNPHIHAKWMMNPYQVSRHNEYFRFITSGFIHNDYMHLFFNMFTFYFFGGVVEHIHSQLFGGMGGTVFVGFYLAGIVISDLPTFFKYRNIPRYNSLGASGGVAAVVFSSIMFFPLNNICLYGIICIPGFILGILYLMYSVYQGKRMADNINHDAHIYGAIFGVVFSIIIHPQVVITFFQQIITYRPF